MSGILSILREVLSIFFPNQAPQRSLFWNCVIISFVISMAALWVLEHLKLKEVSESLSRAQDNNKPAFALVVNNMAMGYALKIKGTVVFIDVGIKNTGAPSIAYRWGMSLASSKVHKNRVLPTVIPENTPFYMNNSKVIFTKENKMEERTIIPIPRNSLAGGWLRFDFPGVELNDFDDATKTIHVRDIFDVEYSTSFIHIGERSESLQLYTPGSGPNPFSPKTSDDK